MGVSCNKECVKGVDGKEDACSDDATPVHDASTGLSSLAAEKSVPSDADDVSTKETANDNRDQTTDKDDTTVTNKDAEESPVDDGAAEREAAEREAAEAAAKEQTAKEEEARLAAEAARIAEVEAAAKAAEEEAARKKAEEEEAAKKADEAKKKAAAAAAAAKKKKEFEAKKKAEAEKKKKKAEEEAKKKADEEAKQKAEEKAREQREAAEKKAKEEAAKVGFKTKEDAFAAIDGMIDAIGKVKGGFKELQKELKGVNPTRNIDHFAPLIARAKKQVWPIISPYVAKYGYEQDKWTRVVLDDSTLAFVVADKKGKAKFMKLVGLLPLPDNILSDMERNMKRLE